MKVRYYITALLVSLFFAPLLKAQEFRFGAVYSHKLSKQFKVDAKLQLRDNMDTDNTPLDQGLIQGKIAYSPFAFLSVATSARYTHNFQEIDEEQNPLNDRVRVTFDLSLKTKRFDNGIKISNRFRYQFSETSKNRKDFIRNRLKLNYKFTKRTLPYVALEPFYEINKQELEGVRLYFGSEFKLFGNKLDVFLITDAEIQKNAFDSMQMFGVMYEF